MPCMVVHRNFPIDKETVDALQDRLSTIITKVLKKPKAYIMVIVDDQKTIRFGESDKPALFIEVKSIGLPGESASSLSKEICSAAEQLLSVDRKRIYIEFADSPRDMWGWNGGTF